MDEPIAAGQTCALILAGGRSSRMGTDKSLLELDGQTLLRRAADFWLSAGDIVDAVLLAPGTETHLQELPARVIPVYDVFPGCGPMAGIHAAFARTDAELLYVSAIDMPRLDRAALLPAPKGDAAVYVKDGMPEPLFGVYRRSALPAMERALRSGSRKMSVLLRELDTEYIPLPPAFAPVLENLNTPAEYLRARAGSPPTVVFMGWSGSGKTTFLEKLLPELTARGLQAAVIKHDGHGFQMDRPGKDTWRFTRAGAAAVAISGPEGWAVLSPNAIELETLRAKLPPVDLILVEGHKGSPYPKFQIYRRALGKPFIPDDGTMAAVISDDEIDGLTLPRISPDDAAGCADFLLRTFLPKWDAPA